MTCASCHSFDRRDTPSVDADGLRRAGSSIFGAAHRTNIKKSGTNLVALGGNVCVIHFMKGEEPGMNAQELADLDSFLKAGGGADRPSAKNIDYASLKWTLPDRLTGGDARKGAALAGKTCITCHGVDGKKSRLIDVGSDLDAGSYQATDLRKLALRIRNPQYKQDQEMPGYSDLRLSNEELVDLLAWLTTKP